MTEPIAAYRQCRCSTVHRSYTQFARCLWKAGHYVGGDGPYAVLTTDYEHGGRWRTVRLHASQIRAREAVAAGVVHDERDRTRRARRIVRIELATPRPTSPVVNQANDETAALAAASPEDRAAYLRAIDKWMPGRKMPALPTPPREDRS